MTDMLQSIISRPRSVMTILVVLLAAGIAAYIAVPKDANPDIDVPVFYISVTQQGISPQDAERLLVRPLETKLRGLDGLKEITGTAGEGHASILLEFNIDFDKDAALADVRDKVDQAKAELPDEADEPQIFETNFSLVPTVIVVLSGNVPERTLYQHARRLKTQIEGIPTVLEANLAGHREEMIEVNIDTVRLESYHITQQELIDAVTRNNRMVAAGALEAGNGRFNVKVPGLFETLDDIYATPIKTNGDSVVTLGDVAEIRRTFMDAASYTRFNGRPAIAIPVIKRIGTNIVDNNEQVRKVVAEFSKDWPKTINVDFTLDQSEFIFEVLGSLQSSIMTAIALVMIVVVGALGLRSGLLVGIAIPTSFMIGFLIVGLLGMTVNMMVMFGLVLTVGMLVDGAIVMIEYAERKMAEGMKRAEAFSRAAELMFWPIVSSTATTLVAFMPMLLWPGVSGEFMSYLPIMVIIILSASLLTALIFLPVMGSLIGKSGASKHEMEVARSLSGSSKIDYDKLEGLTGRYVRILRALIGRPILTSLAAIAIMATIVVQFAQVGTGVEFFVDEEPQQAIIPVSARGNLSPQDMRDLVVEVEHEVLQVPGIKTVYTSAGTSRGFQIGESQDKPIDQIGMLTLEFEDVCCRRPAKELFAEIRERTSGLAGVHVEVRKIEGGPPTGKAIRLELTSNTYAGVGAATAKVRAHLDQMEGLRDREDSRPLPGIEWNMQVDREQAGRFGTDIASVGAMIQLVTNGILIGTNRPEDSEDEIDIRVRLPEVERSLDRLDELRIRTVEGLVPIGNFVKRTAEPKVSTITRQNGRFAMMVKADVLDGVFGDDKVKELDAWLKTQDLGDGIQYRFRGADAEQKEAGDFLGKAMLGSLFLMFIILVTQFNSFYQTVLTLMTVVMSSVGVLLGIMVTGQNFSVIMTGTGIVALAGIVVNNAIVLIDTYNRMHGELGLHPVDAALRTAAQRLRPILLTTVTTILGLVPMALQISVDFFNRAILAGGTTSIWWVQLSTAVIFGLGFSTLLTLVLIPTLLAAPTVLKERIQRLRNRFGKRTDDRSAMPAPVPAYDRPQPIPGLREAAE